MHGVRIHFWRRIVPQRLCDLFDLYRLRKLNGKESSTEEKFEIAIRWFAEAIGHPPRVTDLNDDNIARFIRWGVRERKLAAPSVNMYAKKLLALWRFACRRGWLKQWPETELLNEPARTPTAWARDELQKLFAACKSAPGHMGGIPAADWFLIFLSVGWDAGERPGALLKIRSFDVKPDAGWILVRAETRKGKATDRVYWPHATTLALCRDSLASHPRDLLLPFPHVYETLLNRYRALLKSAGLPTDTAHMPHCMRRSHGTWLEICGGDPVQSLGHSDRKIYERSYRDTRLIKGIPPSSLLFRPTG